jgi:hypothetical protein
MLKKKKKKKKIDDDDQGRYILKYPSSAAKIHEYPPGLTVICVPLFFCRAAHRKYSALAWYACRVETSAVAFPSRSNCKGPWQNLQIVSSATWGARML